MILLKTFLSRFLGVYESVLILCTNMFITDNFFIYCMQKKKEKKIVQVKKDHS